MDKKQLEHMIAFQELYLKHFDTLVTEGSALPLEGYRNSLQLIAKLKGWENRCLNLIQKTFGKDSNYYQSLLYCASVPIDEQRQLFFELMNSAKRDYEELLPATTILEQNEGLEPLIFLERLCTRFHLIVRQLRERHEERCTIDVNDEYDVQDLIHSLLKINFNNIRKEEWTPSYAGTCSRMDFLLKNEGIVIETKKTREGLNHKILEDQLIIDIERYQAHPDCKLLLCFVYDPEGRLTNPEAIELDLSKPHGNIEVKVIVSPKGM
jgi:hypothetical protein